MTRTSRYTAIATAALSVTLGAAALAPAASAGVDDSINVQTNTTPTQITVFPQGSSLVGPVNVEIGQVIVDAGDLNVILETVSLLSQVIGPIG